MIRLELPYPPTVNTYWRYSRGKFHVSTKGKKYRKFVGELLFISRIKKATGDVRLRIESYPPDKRLRDLDNVLKALLDALEHGGAFESDNQVCKLTIERKEPDKNNPRVIVEIEP